MIKSKTVHLNSFHPHPWSWLDDLTKSSMFKFSPYPPPPPHTPQITMHLKNCKYKQAWNKMWCSLVFNFPVNTGVPFTQNTKSVTKETMLTSLHAGAGVGGVMWAEVKYYLSSRTGQPALLSRVPPPHPPTHPPYTPHQRAQRLILQQLHQRNSLHLLKTHTKKHPLKYISVNRFFFFLLLFF